MSEDINNLRERVAVTEANVKSHADMLSEMKEAVVGINASLHALTRLEERLVSSYEYNQTTRQMLTDDRQARREQSQSFGERIGNLEILMGEVNNQTTLNSHGRTIWEKYLPLAIATVIGPTVTVFLTLQFITQ